MPWTRPSLKQLYERISRDFSGRLQEGQDLIQTSAEAVLAKIWAGACHLMHGFLAWAFLQVFVDTAEGVYLERWARVWGLHRKDASFAKGVQVVFPSVQGQSIVAGTALLYQGNFGQKETSGESNTSQQYIVEKTVQSKDGFINVEVKALHPGINANIPAGTSLQLVSPIAGVDSQGTVEGEGITGGADAETDESLRSRLLERLRKPPRGGAKHDYVAWAKEVPGVTRAWCYPHGLGVGTVSLCFVCDDNPSGPLPSQEKVGQVQTHIDTLRPASVKEFSAFAPEIFPITVKIRLSPDNQSVRDGVKSSLGDLIWREGEPDSLIPLTHLAEAISLSPGEFDHKLLEPMADIEIPAGYFPILSAVHFDDEG